MKRLLILLLLTSSIIYGQNYGRGLTLNKYEYNKIPLKAKVYSKATLPNSYSLKKYTPYVSSQGMYGTCVGWSTGWAFRSTLEAINNNWIDKDKITSNAFSPLFVYFNATDDHSNGCKKGSSIYRAFGAMKNIGIPYFNDFSPMCAETIPSDIFDKAQSHRIKDFQRLFNYDSDKNIKINTVKQSLVNKHPVVIGIACPNSFDIAKGVWMPIESIDEIDGGHAITVIGYDDNKYGGSFEIMNSWGSDWGNNGFIWIKYDDFANYTFEAVDAYLEKKENNVSLEGNVELIAYNNSKLPIKKIKGINSKGQNTVVVSQISDYTVNKDLFSGDRYKMLANINKPVYLYAIATDLNNNVSVLFPNKPDISSLIDGKNSNIPIPNDGYWIQLDNNKGVDFLIVLFSLKELDINTISNNIENTNGAIDNKISKTLSNLIISKDNIKLDDDKIHFIANTKNKNVFALIIKINHK